MKNTDLDKSLSPLNIWSLALGSIIGWGAFVMPGDVFLPTAGPLGSAIGMMIGAIIMITISISYGYMIQKFPVAGGEFAFAFKGFGRTHAFICAWFLGLAYLSIVPLNATALGMIGRYMFPGVLQQGYLYTIAGWEVYLGEILLASGALILFAFLSIKGVNISGKIQTVMAFSLVGSIILLLITAIISPETSFSNLSPAFSPENTSVGGIMAIVAIAPWAYVGFDSIPQAAEEFNFPPKKALKLMVTAILLGALMYVAMTVITGIVYPWEEFIASEPFWATGTAVEDLLGQVGLLLLAIALITAIISGMIGFYMSASRLLLSMARAQALPSWFGNIHSKYKTPNNAIIFILILSLIAPWFGRQVLQWVVDMASIGAAIGYFYTTASAFKLLRKEKGKTFYKISSLVGAVLSIGFIVLLIVPGMPSFLVRPSRIALYAWIILGIVFYAISSKRYNKLSDNELNKLILNKK